MASALFDRLVLNIPCLPSKLSLPAFVYGTAWKKDATADLVYQALCNGFTAVDTANQPKHYREELVGDGVRRAIREGKVKRLDLYLQTKFTSVGGQDPSDIPYDPKSSIAEQVKTSVETSLRHFRPSDDSAALDQSYLDAVVLHSPLPTLDDTLEAWLTLEQYVPKKIRALGISNCPLFTLMDLYERANIKPAVVQNRFYPGTKFDIGVRKFCGEKSMVYQSFWTLTANPNLLSSQVVGSLAHRVGISHQAALYGLVLGLGNTVILNGTKSQEHMKADFEALQKLRGFAQDHLSEWEKSVEQFRKLTGEMR